MNQKVDTSLAEALEGAATAGDRTAALFDFMTRRGQSFYDESVTQLAHALQAAHLARGHGATNEQITAALLHDIGHFLMDEDDEHSDFQSEDWYHEAVGADVLSPYFEPSVTEPIRLHVPAKRYLCTVDPTYYESLSRASKRSFELQGGKMSDEEVAEFERHPHYETAALLRRWDDGAKVEELSVSPLQEYHATVAACFTTRSSPAG